MFHRSIIGRLVIPVVAFAITAAGHGGVIFVDADAAAGGDGASWRTAFDHLDDALAVAKDGDDIWVAAGRYVPGVRVLADLPNSVSFVIPPGVGIYGGFRGDETQLNQRNPAANETILSGDVLGDDDGTEASWGDNAYTVVRVIGEFGDGMPGRVVDGFTITQGRAVGGEVDGEFFDFGGGVVAINASIVMAQCNIVGNYAISGGGATLVVPVAELTRCDFQENVSVTGGGGLLSSATTSTGDVRLNGCNFNANRTIRGSGSAAFIQGRATRFDGCRFIQNESPFGGAVYLTDFNGLGNQGSSAFLSHCLFLANLGGAIRSFFFDGDVDVNHCTFRANFAPRGGAIFFRADEDDRTLNIHACEFRDNVATVDGGALHIAGSESFLDLSLSQFINNSANVGDGGGVHMQGGRYHAVYSTFLGNTAVRGGGFFSALNSRLEHCILAGNKAVDGGGAYLLVPYGNPNVEFCTVVDNFASQRGSGVFIDSRDIHRSYIANSIIWNNVSAVHGQMQQVNGDGLTNVEFSTVGGIDLPLNHNLDQNPQFLDPLGPDGRPASGDEDFRLHPRSPAINAGDPNTLPDADAIDFAGSDRLQLCRVDMGAFESDSGLQRDCDNNGVADRCDIALLAAADCDDNGIPDVCQRDGDGNGVPDVCDAVNHRVGVFHLAPIQGGQQFFIDLPDIADAFAPITIRTFAAADLRTSGQVISVYLNGTYINALHRHVSATCSDPAFDELVIPAGVVGQLVDAPGDATLRFTPTAPVSGDVCPDSVVAVAIAYTSSS